VGPPGSAFVVLLLFCFLDVAQILVVIMYCGGWQQRRETKQVSSRFHGSSEQGEKKWKEDDRVPWMDGQLQADTKGGGHHRLP